MCRQQANGKQRWNQTLQDSVLRKTRRPSLQVGLARGLTLAVSNAAHSDAVCSKCGIEQRHFNHNCRSKGGKAADGSSRAAMAAQQPVADRQAPQAAITAQDATIEGLCSVVQQLAQRVEHVQNLQVAAVQQQQHSNPGHQQGQVKPFRHDRNTGNRSSYPCSICDFPRNHSCY